MDNGIELLIKNKTIINIKPLNEQKIFILPEDDIDLNAYRILFLIYSVCRDNAQEVFWGRRKLILYDFLLKYPKNIKVVAKIKGKDNLIEDDELLDYGVEWPLEKIKEYVLGSKQYNLYFSYLISKGLVEVRYKKRIKSIKEFYMSLTSEGMLKANEIYGVEIEWIKIIKIINLVFGKKSSEDGILKFINERLRVDGEKVDY